MVSLVRNKRILYLCKQYVENGITKYKEPIKIETNYQATNSTGEIIALGAEYVEYLKITDTKDVACLFENQDKCYVFVQLPEKHERLCENADFIVNGTPIIGLNQGIVQLKRLTGEKEVWE